MGLGHLLAAIFNVQGQLTVSTARLNGIHTRQPTRDNFDAISLNVSISLPDLLKEML